LALEAVPGLGPDAARRLLEAIPDPRLIISASASQLVPLVGQTLAAALAKPVSAEDARETLD
jgi:hypothetical protein